MYESVVRNQYNQMAPAYDWLWQGYLAKTLGFLKTWAAIPPSAHVLDIGCGTGIFEQLVLADQPKQFMIGVDISNRMLRLAQRKCRMYSNVAFYTASAEAMPFAVEQFDIVVTASAFHYFNDPAAALTETKRVLKPGGVLIILDWCRDFLVCQACDFVLKLADPAHRQCYTQNELHRLLVASHYEIYRSIKIRFGLIWGLMAVAAIPNQGEHNRILQPGEAPTKP
jgi:ubiquinone/menaquinone biosynthesis C-methylase UbiE